MKELFRIPRIAVPAFNRRTMSLAVAAVIVAGAVITPGVSLAAKVFTLKKAAKISLGNTTTVTVQGVAVPQAVTPATVMCPPNHQALNGGADSPTLAGTHPDGYPWLIVSVPVAGGARSIGWYVEILSAASSTPHQFTAYAVCAP